MCNSSEAAPQGLILNVFHHQYLFSSKWEMVFIFRSPTIKFHSFPPEADLNIFPGGNYHSVSLHRTQNPMVCIFPSLIYVWPRLQEIKYIVLLYSVHVLSFKEQLYP